MFHPMPIVRVLFYGVASWFYLTIILTMTWMILPSPSYEQVGRADTYFGNQLLAGKTITRVYDTDDWYPNLKLTGLHRRSFALEYRLDIADDTLHIGSDQIIFRRQAVSHSAETVSSLVKQGDQDGSTPSWFSHADRTLLFWWIHREAAAIDVQVQWVDQRVHEVRAVTSSSNGFGEVIELASTQPLLRIEIDAISGSMFPAGLNIRHAPNSSSPSRTYHIRLAIMALIAPAGLLAYSIICAIKSLGKLIFDITLFLTEIIPLYIGILFVAWLVKGKPPLGQFLARQPITNLMTRYMGIEPESSAEGSERLGERRTISSVADFFRSSAPLDDLLASFESTRGLTEPFRLQGAVGTEADTERGPDPGDAGAEEKTNTEKSQADAQTDLEAASGDAEETKLKETTFDKS